MTKVVPESDEGKAVPSAPSQQILDPTKLPKTDSLPITEDVRPPPPPLPKHLADFKEYVDSKCCYYGEPLAYSNLISVQEKVPYQCRMKVLVEERRIQWSKTPARWTNETLLGSRTLGRLFESTERGQGEGMANMWDYEFNIPNTDKKASERRNLPEGIYLTRCSNCRGKCIVTCTNYECRGDGRVQNNTMRCPKCHGRGTINCPSCSGLGGFLHSPTLHVNWHTRESTWYCQNSYLTEKRIRKAALKLFWNARIMPWSKNSSIANAVESIVETTPDIELKTSVIQHYEQKHLNKIKDTQALRRWECAIERLDFEEIAYSMVEKYTNQHYSELGNTFRFCQYPGPQGQSMIYEDDYPLNCCGCFGEKTACYSCCCNLTCCCDMGCCCTIL